MDGPCDRRPQDPKYRDIARTTPTVLPRVLSLLDALRSADGKRTVLRVISVIGTKGPVILRNL